MSIHMSIPRRTGRGLHNYGPIELWPRWTGHGLYSYGPGAYTVMAVYSHGPGAYTVMAVYSYGPGGPVAAVDRNPTCAS